MLPNLQPVKKANRLKYAAKLLLLTIVFFLPGHAFAQEDTKFWFVAPYVFNAGRDFDRPVYLRMATRTSAATVTVSMPADPTFTPIINTIPANSALSIDLTPWVLQLENSPGDAILNKGLLISSTANITAYYEEISQYDPEAFALKGRNALGTEFYISSQNSYDESTAYSGAISAFDIVATQNHTHVTITPAQPILGHPANVPFTITLNAGQTYSAVAISGQASAHLQGSYVTSDQPIAITLKDDLVQVSSCADLIGDQTVPTSVLGTDYIVVRGYLDSSDSIYILATADNTAIYQDGNSTPIATLSKGQSYSVFLGFNSTFIHATNKIYVYHLTGNGCEGGSAIIPKLNCTGSQSVSVVRGSPDLFAVMITTKNGNQNNFTVNGNSSLITGSDFSPVPGTGGAYVAARIDLSGSTSVNVPINFSNSSGVFSLGFINGGTNDGTAYGFFSDFKSSNVQSTQETICQGSSVQLTAYGGASYKWSPTTGLSNPNIANPVASPAVTTNYMVLITSSDGCVDTAYVKVNVLGVQNVTTTTSICQGQSYTLPSGQVVSATGTYIDALKHKNSTCDSIVTTLHLTVLPPPSVTIAADQTSICSGTLVTFKATPADAGTTQVYHWFVNGAAVGTNSPTFASSTLANGSTITCKMTSNAQCEQAGGSTSNIVTMTVSTSGTPTITITASQTVICAGTQVTFNATPFFGGAAPQYQWLVNGIPTGPSSATFATTSLLNGDVVSCKLTSNATCATTPNATSNPIAITVNSLVTPAITIGASQTIICPGSSITFTATPVNGGSAPAYQWLVNGIPTGPNSATFATSSLSNGDKVSCTLTSNAVCATQANATSNSIPITVNTVVPSVSITISKNNICAGDAVTFTAIPVNGGASPQYQWLLNGNIVGNNNPSLTIGPLSNGDVVNCNMTSNANCATPAIVTSNSITMIVNPLVTPSVSITASPTTICPGTTVTFTATPVNGGATPQYQWQVNGANAGTNSPTFTHSSLANGDVISCILTSNATCLATPNATSNNITITITPPVTPAVTIAVSQNNICAGTSVTFIATPVNGGANPAYQWLVNGSNAGAGGPTFTSALSNGDKVSCTLVSNVACVTTPNATSNSITMTVNPLATPAVTIAASQTTICSGTLVTFIATPVNGGANPAYQWLVNGINAGTNSPTFVSNALSNGDKVSCVITSSVTCVTTPNATSNNVTMTVNTLVPAVSIGASQNNICAGASVTFTATPVNGGTAPQYQWLVNGTNAGTNSTTFSSSALSNGDVVSCSMTSNAACATPVSISSNNITMVVNAFAPPTVSITASQTTICPGTQVTFTATPVNGGSAPVYQWLVNGVSAGINSPTFASSTLSNGDMVSCNLTSNAACITTPNATSNNISITVNILVPSVSIAASDNNVCDGTPITFTATPVNGGTAPQYQWFVNGSSAGSNSPTFNSSSFANGDVISCTMTSNAACATPVNTTSNSTTMNIFPLPIVSGGGDKTIQVGSSVVLTATATGNIASTTWTPSTGLNDPLILNPTASPSSTTEYTLTVQTTDGCAATGSVTVNVQRDVIIPNTFTPNGDGINDTWDIKNLKEYQDCTVQIFDRWGIQIFNSRGYGKPWDGTYNGQRVAFGTYYYVINLNNNTHPLAGFVVVIR